MVLKLKVIELLKNTSRDLAFFPISLTVSHALQSKKCILCEWSLVWDANKCEQNKLKNAFYVDNPL